MIGYERGILERLKCSEARPQNPIRLLRAPPNSGVSFPAPSLGISIPTVQWTDAKCKSVLWSDKSTFHIVFGNHGCRALWAKEENDQPDTITAKRYIQNLECHMLPCGQCLFQGDNANPHSACVTTAWLHSERVRVLARAICKPKFWGGHN